MSCSFCDCIIMPKKFFRVKTKLNYLLFLELNNDYVAYCDEHLRNVGNLFTDILIEVNEKEFATFLILGL